MKHIAGVGKMVTIFVTTRKRSESMFVGISKEDVYSIYKKGRDKPTGKVHINISRISYIDGNNVIIDDWCITVSDRGISKILSFITE